MITIKQLLSSVILLIIYFTTQAQYREVKEWDYKVSVPKDWLPVSKIITKELEMKDVEYKHYVRAYSNDSTTLTMPYLVLSYHGIPGSENVLFKEVIEIQKGVLKRKGLEVEFVADSSRYCFYAEVNMGDMIRYLGYSLGKNGILYVDYQAFSYDQSSKKIFLDVLHSVQHNEAFQNPKKAEAKEYMKKSGQYMIYALIGFAVLLVMYFMKKKVW